MPTVPAETGAFRGPGRVLGRTSGSRSKSGDSNSSPGHYNLRPRRNISASSVKSARGSGSSAGDHNAATDSTDDPNDDDYVENAGSRRASLDSETTHTAVVMSDNIGTDGIRRVEMQLPTSPKPVTVVLPQANDKKTGQQRGKRQTTSKSSRGQGRKRGKTIKQATSGTTLSENVLPPEVHLPKTLPSPKLPTPESDGHPLTPVSKEAPPITFRRSLFATVEDIEDIDPKSFKYLEMLDMNTVSVANDDVQTPIPDLLTPELQKEDLHDDIQDGDDSDVYGENWYGEDLFEDMELEEPAEQHLSDAIDRTTAHTYRGNEQLSVGERLEQALAYLTSEYAMTNPQRHQRTIDLEAYLNFLQGVEKSDEDEGEDNHTYAGVDGSLLEALALAEAEEAKAVANDKASRPNAEDDRASILEQPPVIYGANTRRLLEEVRRRLEAFRDLHKNDHEHDVRFSQPVPIPSSVSSGAAVQSLSLQALLQTCGRLSFAGRLISNIQAAQFGSSPRRLTGHTELGSPQDASTEQNETHPYTVQMARYRRLRQHWMQEARSVAEQVHGDTPGWVTLPPFEGAFSQGYSSIQLDDDSDGTSGTIIPRQPLPASMEQDRRLLTLLRSLGRLLPQRMDVAPRPLLEEVHRYIEQGLRGDTLPDASLQLRDGYDYHGRQRSATAQRPSKIRRINETEARWLHFLLSDSTNEALALPLPAGPHLEEDTSIEPADTEAVKEKTLEEGSRELYHVFARRLQALLNDRSSRGVGGLLFHTAETQVPVTTLVHVLNSQSGNGTTMTKTQFSVYDALHFLSRLSSAGRCRFIHHPFEQAHGFVQRPRLTIHPEHRIHPSWMMRIASKDTDAQDDADTAIGAPQRDYDVDTSWAESIACGRAAEGIPLSADVRTFFCALAFRYGRTLRELELVERPQWDQYLQEAEGGEDGRHEAMRASLRTWHRTYEALLLQHGVRQEAKASGIPASLVEVVRLADPETFAKRNSAGGHGLTEKDARVIISKRLLAEAASGQMTPDRKGLWDWASPAIIGQAPSYFHMDRWPLHLQSRETAARVADEARIALDPDVLWDPASEDPASAKYMWLFSGPGYGYQRTKETHPRYLLGDTALQRQVLVQDLTRRVAAEAGIAMEDDDDEREREGRGFWGWLGSKMSFRKRKRYETRDEDEDVESGDEDRDEGPRKKPRTIIFRQTPLPEVTGITKSVDWVSPVVRAMYGSADVYWSEYGGEGDEDRGEDGEDDEDGEDGSIVIEDTDRFAML
ncbi:hypothetical protein SBRCBS47491_000089 [Sporothrix bragantina]|uniref:Uncharacterized protein n=1 Tax=Sporothrix bragantina TaxID=671064 RepID=A0ABP0AKT9_9PEZI